ncbi:hypothetical protein Cob_v010712 [Colletotrichum orbiculare MAFF 240422]|uniref:Uncharacterized protein n=1 Tax=Colletotrichum orbiculare (strain 104-T / ATCC 96160 / CBS 514.97 / LARS 414 / MAFF 240422) TaxID=1213857 RepID=A0A484FEQ1_COLOR|nr:hypothetical protein Cob_v010712 [Colletotrichum orbiculare MAFF 240422]
MVSERDAAGWTFASLNTDFAAQTTRDCINQSSKEAVDAIMETNINNKTHGTVGLSRHWNNTTGLQAQRGGPCFGT